jgi:Putative zinc-finger
MTSCKEIRKNFVEALYGELDPESQKIFDAHLEICAKCRKRFRRIKRALRIMNQRVRVEPGQEFWDGYWGRLEQRMQREQKRPVARWAGWIYRAAAVIVLIGIGVVLGKLWVPKPAQLVKKPAAEVPVDLVTQRTEDFLGRSEVLLLGIVNFNPKDQDPAALDIPRQKQISHELIQEASYLKQELSESDNQPLEKLVSDLELILLQIANLEQKEDVPEIELVKSGVDRKGLLLKINLEQMRTEKSLTKKSRSAVGKQRL